MNQTSNIKYQKYHSVFYLVIPSPPAFLTEPEEEKLEVAVVPMTPIDETLVDEDEDEILPEVPLKPFTRNRRSAKSRLGLISGNQGFHSVKLPLHRRQSSDANSVQNTEQAIDGENVDYVVRRRRLVSISGKELWRSTKQRVEERKMDFDKRLSQVEKIARRYTIKHSQSVRRRAKEKAVVARRSTMAASASNEANRPEFITKRNGRFQDDCRKGLFQEVIEESEVDGGSGETNKDEVRDLLNQETEAGKKQREEESATGSSEGDVLQLHTVKIPFDNEARGFEIQEQGRSRGDEEGADQQHVSGCEAQKDKQKSVKKVSIIEYTESLDV